MIVRFLVIILLMWFPVTASENNNNAYRDTARMAYQATFSKKISGTKWNAVWDKVLNERLAQQVQDRHCSQVAMMPAVSIVSFSQDDVVVPEKSRNEKRNARKREKAKEKKILNKFFDSLSSDASVDVVQPIVEKKRAASPLTLQCRSIIGRLKTIDNNLGRKEFFAESIRPQSMEDLCRDVAEYTNNGRTINDAWTRKISGWRRIVEQDSYKQQQNGNNHDCDDDQRIIKDLKFVEKCLRKAAQAEEQYR